MTRTCSYTLIAMLAAAVMPHAAAGQRLSRDRQQQVALLAALKNETNEDVRFVINHNLYNARCKSRIIRVTDANRWQEDLLDYLLHAIEQGSQPLLVLVTTEDAVPAARQAAAFCRRHNIEIALWHPAALKLAKLPPPRLNINTATLTELQDLPDIGEKTARKIIEYRQIHGNFPNIEAIQNISGIGKDTFNGLKHLIRAP